MQGLAYSKSKEFGCGRWWVLKCKFFAQESTCSKEIVLKQPWDELWFVKKVPKSYFQSQFSMSKSTEFKKKKSRIMPNF